MMLRDGDEHCHGDLSDFSTLLSPAARAATVFTGFHHHHYDDHNAGSVDDDGDLDDDGVSENDEDDQNNDYDGLMLLQALPLLLQSSLFLLFFCSPCAGPPSPLPSNNYVMRPHHGTPPDTPISFLTNNCPSDLRTCSKFVELYSSLQVEMNNCSQESV